MRRILLVKTSSLGDVVHNLPVVNDIRTRLGEASIDWVVEHAFAQIPALHPGLRRVIPCELRRWRRSWYTTQTRCAWKRFLRDLRADRYDAIIDTQGLLKSALVTRCAIGARFGLDWRSSREPLRAFYDRTFSVPWLMHAVERNRRLCALALGYEPVGAPDYGVVCPPARAAWLPQRPFVVFLHATSHPRKLWPVAQWMELGNRIAKLGFGAVLPWGSDMERERAHAVAKGLPDAVVPGRLELAQLAAVLAAAKAAVGVDTGLTHLAAAVGIPTIGIYGATNPRATGVLGGGQAINVGDLGRFPSVQEVMDAMVQACHET
jgi:heptosyltransferase-1